MTESATKRYSRKTAWMVGLLALFMSISTVWQVHHYGESRPTTADSSHQHAVKIHSRVVYLTTGEYAAAIITHVMSIGAIGIFLGLLLKSVRTKS
jgi:hypothetical protein